MYEKRRLWYHHNEIVQHVTCPQGSKHRFDKLNIKNILYASILYFNTPRWWRKHGLLECSWHRRRFTAIAYTGERNQEKKLQLHEKKVMDKRDPVHGYKAGSKIFHYQAADEYKYNVNITAFRFTTRTKGHVNFGSIIPLWLPNSICSTIRTNTTFKTPRNHLCSTTYFGRLCRPCFGRLWSAMMADTNGRNMW